MIYCLSLNTANRPAMLMIVNFIYHFLLPTNSAIANLNEDLNNICSWCCRNSLLINPDKTKVLFIGIPQLLRRLPTVPVSMLGKEITPVTVAKDLGIYIDQSLTYNDHVTKTASNCLNKLIQINRIKHLLDKKTMILLMNCFIFTARRFGRTLVVPILRNSNWFRISLLRLFWDSESSIIFHKALDLLIGCLSAIDSI